jgi:hypothetical protein
MSGATAEGIGAKMSLACGTGICSTKGFLKFKFLFAFGGESVTSLWPRSKALLLPRRKSNKKAKRPFARRPVSFCRLIARTRQR